MSKLSRSRSRRERPPPPSLDDSASEFSSLCTAIVAPKVAERTGGEEPESQRSQKTQRSQRSQAPPKSSVFDEEVVSLSVPALVVPAPAVSAPPLLPCPVCQQPAVNLQHLKLCGARHGLTTQVHTKPGRAPHLLHESVPCSIYIIFP